jgi:hypothetical protein
VVEHVAEIVLRRAFGEVFRQVRDGRVGGAEESAGEKELESALAGGTEMRSKSSMVRRHRREGLLRP